MAVFLILIFGSFFLQLVEGTGYYKEGQKKSSKSLIFFFAFLTALIMLRHESVGNDTKNYIHYFELFSDMDWSELLRETRELGYRILNKIISFVFDETQLFVMTVALLVSGMIYPTYKRLRVDTSLTVILFLSMPTFVMMFSGIRQMLAIAIGFIAYEFTRKKKLIPFIFTVALAMTFHTSAFIISFMYPVYHVRIRKKSLLWVIPLLGITLLFNEAIFSFLATYLEQYTKYEADITSTGAYSMLILFAVFTFFAFAVPDESVLDVETLGLRNLLVLSLALQMFAPLHTLAMRMNYYYIVFIPLLIPKIIKYRKEEMRQVALLARFVMVIFFTVYFFYNAYTSDNNLRVFPYHFFWESV